MQKLWLVAAPSLLLLAFACGEEEEFACTLIGCVNQVSLDVVDGAGQNLSIKTATLTASDGSRLVVDCARPPTEQIVDAAGQFELTAETCRTGGLTAIVSSWTAASLDVELQTTGGASFMGSLPLTLERSRPNGEGCEPECVNGSGQAIATQ